MWFILFLMTSLLVSHVHNMLCMNNRSSNNQNQQNNQLQQVPKCNVQGCSKDCWQELKGWYFAACTKTHAKQLPWGFKPTCIKCKQNVCYQNRTDTRLFSPVCSFCFDQQNNQNFNNSFNNQYQQQNNQNNGQRQFLLVPRCNSQGCNQDCWEDPDRSGWYSTGCKRSHCQNFIPICIICNQNNCHTDGSGWFSPTCNFTCLNILEQRKNNQSLNTQTQQNNQFNNNNQNNNTNNTDIYFFFDDNPNKSESFNQAYDFLGNFYPCDITLTIGNQLYIFANAEAAYQALKFRNYQNILQQLTQVTSGYQAWDLARRNSQYGDTTIHNVNPNTGKTYKEEWMLDVVWAKFVQNQQLARQLKNTGNVRLIEWTHNDDFWGVNRSSGQGQNILGKILMEVRQNLP